MKEGEEPLSTAFRRLEVMSNGTIGNIAESAIFV